MQTIPVALLVLDFDIYPRGDVNSVNVRRLADALEVGAELPPIVADRKTLRVVDGFHRTTVYRHQDPNQVVPVELVNYRDERTLVLDAATRNAEHGMPLQPYDHARLLILADSVGATHADVAMALRIPLARLERIETTRMAFKPDGKSKLSLKRPLGHLVGQKLTKNQVDANQRASGWSPAYHAEQIVMLIEADAVDWADERLRVALGHLKATICDLTIPD